MMFLGRVLAATVAVAAEFDVLLGRGRRGVQLAFALDDRGRGIRERAAGGAGGGGGARGALGADAGRVAEVTGGGGGVCAAEVDDAGSALAAGVGAARAAAEAGGRCG